MHVLLSSTRQWNPGDEFIDRGVRRLISRFLPPDVSWHLWNRNPDLSVHPTSDWHFRDGLVSNCVTTIDKALVDTVVFSGSPEWLGPRCQPIFDFVHSHPQIPVLLIGIGSAAPLASMSDVEIAVLSRSNVLIIARSQELSLQINHILGSTKSVCLPCPSIFASKKFHSFPEKPRIGVILQIDTGIQPIPSDSFRVICRAIDSFSADIDLIAFHESECTVIKRRFPSRRLVYFDNARDYLKAFKNYRAIVSTRLHGALSAGSCGVPSAIIMRDDFRVNSTSKLFDEIVPAISAENSLDWAASYNKSKYLDAQWRTFDFKSKQFFEYSRLLSHFFNNFHRDNSC